MTIEISSREITREYEWRAPQIELWESQDDELLAVGPMGTGKTAAVLAKIDFYCASVPGTKVLLVKKTAKSLAHSVLDEWRDNTVRDQLASGAIIFRDGTKDEPARYEYGNGSIVVIGGLDYAEKWRSSQFDIVMVNEATEVTEHDWETMITRCRNGRLSFSQLIADCNPDKSDHWLLQRVQRGLCRMIEFRHEDNPRMFADGRYTKWGLDYLRKLSHLSGVRYMRWVRGIWADAEGLIWEAYNPAIHLIEPFEVPWDWPRFWVTDWGHSNPFVWQLWTRDPDGVLYLIKEIYMTRRRVEQHAMRVMELMGRTDPTERCWPEHPTHPRPYSVVTDHNPEDMATFSEITGLECTLANKDVAEGIQLVQDRFAENRIFFFTGSLDEEDPWLANRRLPTMTVAEFGTYVWRNPKLKGEGPVKRDDHGSDAMRYRVMDEDSIEEMEIEIG